MLRKILGVTCEENQKWINRFISHSRYFCKSTDNNDHNTKNSNISYVDKSKDEDAESIPSTDRTTKLSDLLENSASFNELTDGSWATTPYPTKPTLFKDKEERPSINPEDTTILLFPGQGTLKVGAIKNYLEYSRVRELFKIGKEILGYNILDLCLNGPQEKLNRTEFNQVATVMTSLSALEKIWEDNPQYLNHCKGVAGYSIGELTALVFSGSLTIEDAIRLANVRGTAMQHASDLTPQKMITVLCKPQTKSMGVICTEAINWSKNMGISEPVCALSTYLYSNAKVLGGHSVAIEYIVNNYKKYNIERIVKLPVSGAFHTELMKPALKPVYKILNDIEIDNPRVLVYSNVTGDPYRSAMDIRRKLPKQIIKPVRWEQIMHSIYKRPQGAVYPETLDLGSQGTMKVILSRINLSAAKQCIVI